MLREPLDRQARDERNKFARRPGAERNLVFHISILRALSGAVD
jgi:hypothetical protein